MSKYFLINGFWKDDKVKFSEEIVSEISDEPIAGDPYTDEDIFFHGLTEDEIKQMIEDKWNCEEDFVITSYEVIEDELSIPNSIIQKARAMMENNPMQFADYDPHTRTYLADALTLLLHEHLLHIPQEKLFDYLSTLTK